MREGNNNFIVLEGVDGSGKSSCARLLAEELEKRGKKTFLTREPGGGSLLGKEIKSLLIKDRNSSLLTPKNKTVLLLADHALHFSNDIVPHLARGETVICDRYFPFSHFAYWPNRAEWMLSTDGYIHCGSLNQSTSCLPEKVFFLDISPKLAFERIKNRNLPEDARNLDEDEMNAVIRRYSLLAEIHYKIWFSLDASQPPAILVKEILSELE